MVVEGASASTCRGRQRLNLGGSCSAIERPPVEGASFGYVRTVPSSSTVPSSPFLTLTWRWNCRTTQGEI